MGKLNLFEQFTWAILLFAWVVHSSICPFLYSLSHPTLGCPISTLNIAHGKTAGTLLSLARQPANCALRVYCGSSNISGEKRCQIWREEGGGDVAVLENKGGGGGLAPFAGVMVARVRHCLEELLLSEVCSSWLLPWPLTQNTAAVMKELPQEGLCSPSLFFKSGGYRAPKILWEASLNLSRAVVLFRSFVSGFLYEYNNNDLPLFKSLPFTDYFGPLQGKLVSSSAPGRG